MFIGPVLDIIVNREPPLAAMPLYVLDNLPVSRLPLKSAVGALCSGANNALLQQLRQLRLCEVEPKRYPAGREDDSDFRMLGQRILKQRRPLEERNAVTPEDEASALKIDGIRVQYTIEVQKYERRSGQRNVAHGRGP